MDEWIIKIAEVLGFNEEDANYVALSIALSIIWIAIMIYKYVAIKHNLPLPNWIKNLKDGGSMGGGGGP